MLGIVAYGIFVLVAYHIIVFNIAPDQVHTGRMAAADHRRVCVARFPFSVFGGLINGFQRYDINNMVGSCSSIIAALVNVAMLLAGFPLVQLVAATTAVRVASFLVYRRNAYHVFPALSHPPVAVSCGRG